MMDELELLKKDWQKKEGELPKLSYNELYQMIWKKSSSIVKWILIISILEFVLPNLLYLAPSFREQMLWENTDLKTYYTVLSAIYYVVVFYFIYQFYKRYKEISVLDNAKNLMGGIIRVRKTVKHYIIFCLTFAFIFFMFFAFSIYLNDEFLLSIEGVKEKANEIPLEKMRTAAFWVFAISGVLFTAVMGGIYFLLYGLLLRKLNRNYKELKRLEV